MIYHIDITSSTNDLAREPQYHHMDVIWAEHQTSGRGQRGHSWHSTEGENLTFSVVLHPTFLPIAEQFLLSEVVALALVDAMYQAEKPFLILDDPFVNLDDGHTKQALELLAELAQNRQILYLTCSTSRTPN